MADEKPKDKGKEKPKSSAPKESDMFVEIVGVIFIFLLLSSIVTAITNFSHSDPIFRKGWAGLTPKEIILAYTRPMSSVLNPIGASVISTKNSIDVLDDAGGKKIGTQGFDAKGKVLKGPVQVNGINYYYVDFDPQGNGGTDGWVSENDIGYVDSNTRPLKTSDPLGSTVSAANDGTSVLDNPGGNTIATESKNSRGRLLKGPATKDGVNYYYVQFNDGTSGWVKQDDLLVEDPIYASPLAKTLLFLWSLITFIKYLLWLVAIIIIILLVRIVRKLTAIRVNNRARLYPASNTSTEPKASANPKWERVIAHIESVNENDWRLAIIEADIMLSELLETMQLVGDTIGEKLKGVEKSDFTTLDQAWEAHKVRNEIAHGGGDFRITQREALRVIELYREVFKEFQFI